MIRLFDEPDRLPDRPPRHIALNRPPQTFPRLFQGDVGEKHERFLSEAANDDERQQIIMIGKINRPDAELETETLGLTSFFFDDGFQEKHRTVLSDLQVIEGPVLIDQIAAFAKADEEPAFVFDQGQKEFIPVAAPVHDPDAFSLGIMADHLGRCQDLDVFALMVRTPLRVEAIIEWQDHGFSRFGADDLKELGAAAQTIFAPVVHSGQIFHFPRIRLADVRKI